VQRRAPSSPFRVAITTGHPSDLPCTLGDRNNLPQHVTFASSLHVFKIRLKTHPFKASFLQLYCTMSVTWLLPLLTLKSFIISACIKLIVSPLYARAFVGYDGQTTRSKCMQHTLYLLQQTTIYIYPVKNHYNLRCSAITFIINRLCRPSYKSITYIDVTL